MTGPYFLPSETARLVLGYLKKEGLEKTAKCLLKECSHLSEYSSFLKRGQEYPTTIMGLTLVDMLESYAQFKLREIERHHIISPVEVLWNDFDTVVNKLRNQSQKSSTVVSLSKLRTCRGVHKNNALHHTKVWQQNTQNAAKSSYPKTACLSQNSLQQNTDKIGKSAGLSATNVGRTANTGSQDLFEPRNIVEMDILDKSQAIVTDRLQDKAVDSSQFTVADNLTICLSEVANAHDSVLKTLDKSESQGTLSKDRDNFEVTGEEKSSSSSTLEKQSQEVVNTNQSSLNSLHPGESLACVVDQDPSYRTPVKNDNVSSEFPSLPHLICGSSAENTITIPTCQPDGISLLSPSKHSIDNPAKKALYQDTDSECCTPQKNTLLLDSDSCLRMDFIPEHAFGRSPRRKRYPPKKRSLELNPGPKPPVQPAPLQIQNDSSNSQDSTSHDDAVPQLLELFLANKQLPEKLAENINKSLFPGAISEDAQQENPAVAEDTGQLLDDFLKFEAQMSDEAIAGIIDMTRIDPAFDNLFKLFTTDKDDSTEKYDENHDADVLFDNLTSQASNVPSSEKGVNTKVTTAAATNSPAAATAAVLQEGRKSPLCPVKAGTMTVEGQEASITTAPLINASSAFKLLPITTVKIAQNLPPEFLSSMPLMNADIPHKPLTIMKGADSFHFKLSPQPSALNNAAPAVCLSPMILSTSLTPTSSTITSNLPTPLSLDVKQTASSATLPSNISSEQSGISSISSTSLCGMLSSSSIVPSSVALNEQEIIFSDSNMQNTSTPVYGKSTESAVNLPPPCSPVSQSSLHSLSPIFTVPGTFSSMDNKPPTAPSKGARIVPPVSAAPLQTACINKVHGVPIQKLPNCQTLPHSQSASGDHPALPAPHPVNGELIGATSDSRCSVVISPKKQHIVVNYHDGPDIRSESLVLSEVEQSLPTLLGSKDLASYALSQMFKYHNEKSGPRSAGCKRMQPNAHSVIAIPQKLDLSYNSVKKERPVRKKPSILSKAKRSLPGFSGDTRNSGLVSPLDQTSKTPCFVAIQLGKLNKGASTIETNVQETLSQPHLKELRGVHDTTGDPGLSEKPLLCLNTSSSNSLYQNSQAGGMRNYDSAQHLQVMQTSTSPQELGGTSQNTQLLWAPSSLPGKSALPLGNQNSCVIVNSPEMLTVVDNNCDGSSKNLNKLLGGGRQWKTKRKQKFKANTDYRSDDDDVMQSSPASMSVGKTFQSHRSYKKFSVDANENKPLQRTCDNQKCCFALDPNDKSCGYQNFERFKDGCDKICNVSLPTKETADNGKHQHQKAISEEAAAAAVLATISRTKPDVKHQLCHQTELAYPKSSDASVELEEPLKKKRRSSKCQEGITSLDKMDVDKFLSVLYDTKLYV